MPRSSSLHPRILVLVLSLAAASIAAVTASAEISAHTLPILFFHGATANRTSGYFLEKNLSTATRPYISLTFCENECSGRDLPTQVTMAIDQIRSITKNDTRFAKGYVFIGHSQGASLARAVIEEMDDHNVHTLISLAGPQNGMFYGPQPTDRIPAQVYLKILAPKMLPPTLFNFSSYSDADVVSGKLTVDFTKMLISQPALQDKLSGAGLSRSPAAAEWIHVNKFIVPYNGLLPTSSCMRRKRNFLKLKAAHFFGSSADDVIAPWQSSVLGKYDDVNSMETLEKDFMKLQVVPMTSTQEYKQDTYGLRTLEKRGGLHLHEIPGVGHRCWVMDATPVGAKMSCHFQPIFETHLYPLLAPSSASARAKHERHQA